MYCGQVKVDTKIIEKCVALEKRKSTVVHEQI